MNTMIIRSSNYFTFVCKRGQYNDVAKVLMDLGMCPAMKRGTYLRGAWGSDGVLVFAKLEGRSKRKIKKALWDARIPGARRP